MLFSISIDGGQPKTVSIDQESFTIGRSPRASIQVENECVSRIHLQIRKNQNGVLFITDLGSSNGTYINNERLNKNEEVQWHTFFPLNLSQKILITLISASQVTTHEISDNKTSFREESKELRDNASRTKTATIAKKAPPPDLKKKSGKNPFLIPVILSLGMGYFLYAHYSNKDDETTGLSTESQSTPLKVSTELTSKALPLVSQNKCLSDGEKNYCNIMKMESERFEGILNVENNLYIFLDFDHRIKNVLFDPSFSFADKKEQVTYLMVFFVFADVTRNFIQPLNIKEVIIVDSSSAPTKINQVIKIAYSELFKLSSTDIETIKAMILKKDFTLFKNVITPIIQVESAY